jgi:hypothetical protein
LTAFDDADDVQAALRSPTPKGKKAAVQASTRKSKRCPSCGKTFKDPTNTRGTEK